LDEKKEYLFNQTINKDNKEEVWKQAPNRQEWGIGLSQVLTEIVEKKKKKLEEGRWRIWDV
jgi:hypothetical protein